MGGTSCAAEVGLGVRRAVRWIRELEVLIGQRVVAVRVVRLVPSRYGIAKITEEGVVLASPVRLGAEPAAVVVSETVGKLHGDVVDVAQRRELRSRERRRQRLP